MKIEKLIGETTEYEKKEFLERKKIRNWLKSISAFANTKNGVLIFGIADDDKIVGLKDVRSDSEFISQKIKERISPFPEFNMKIYKTKEGKELILVEVPLGYETPYYYTGDGSSEAYIRVGNESVVANATELKRLVMRGKNSSYDSLISPYDYEDYSFSKLKERYKVWTGNSMGEKIIDSFGIKDVQGKLTNAGALLADESPIRWSRLFCTRWNGLDKSGGQIDAIDSGEYSGSLIILLNEGMSFVKRNMKTLWKKTGRSRVEMPDYSERSIFESLVNAFIHRDYLINGSEVHIDMFDDRLVIYSPGGMIDGTIIQERNINDVPSTRRNPILADIFARLGYMERQGSGLSKICAAYENLANYDYKKIPLFRSNRVEFTVTLPNLNYKDSYNESINESIYLDLYENESINESINLDFSENESINESINLDLYESESINESINLDLSENESINESINMDLSENESINESINLDLYENESINESINMDLSENESINESINLDLYENESINESIKYLLTQNDELNENHILLLSVIMHNPTITRERIHEETHLSKSTIQRLIKELKNYGYLERKGSRKNGRWVIRCFVLSHYNK